MFLKIPKILKSQGKWFERQQTTILSAATIITVSSIISALSGLWVKRELINQFFDTPESQRALEAFWVAFQIPDMLFQLIIIGALSAAFIPIFTHQKKKDPKVAFKMSSIMMNTLLTLFLAVGAVIFIFARPLTELRTGAHFTPDQIEIVTNLTRIMIFAQFFFAISNFLTGILQSFQRFIMPAIAPILYNLGILIGAVLLSDAFGIYAAGIGVILGAFLHMLIQLPLVIKLGFRYIPSFDLNYHGIGEFFRVMPPRVFAIGSSELRKLLLGFFATSLGNLSFFVMQLGLTLMAIPIRFFGVSISQASLPFLADESDDDSTAKKKRFRGLVVQSLHQISFLTLPASVLLLILRLPVVRLVFGTDNFPWETTLSTMRVVAILALSIPFQAVVHLLIRAFYAMKDTKTPLFISIADVIFYMGLCSIFIFGLNMGLMGIALATALTAVLEFILFMVFLSRRIPKLWQHDLWFPQLKMIVTAFLMAVFLYLPYRILDGLVFNTARTVELIALTVTTGTIGMLVYLYFAALFEIKELRMVAQLFENVSNFSNWSKTLERSDEVLLDSTVEGDGV